MAALNYFVIDRIETGNRIYEYRRQMHLSRDGLADLLACEGIFVSITSIGKWERGEVDISYEFAHALASIFGCDLYGGLISYHLRGFEDERNQPVHLYKWDFQGYIVREHGLSDIIIVCISVTCLTEKKDGGVSLQKRTGRCTDWKIDVVVRR